MLRFFLLVFLCLTQLCLAMKLSSSHDNWNITICYAVLSGFNTQWSSQAEPGHQLAEINREGLEWIAGQNRTGEWIEVATPVRQKWNRIVTQGISDQPFWVTAYRVIYTDDGLHWEAANNGTLFAGNNDQNTKVDHFFDPPFTARTVRILPKKWHGAIGLRFDILYDC